MTQIGDQHLEYLRRSAERAAFMYSVLEARLTITDSKEVKEFAKYLMDAVDASYPRITLELTA